MPGSLVTRRMAGRCGVNTVTKYPDREWILPAVYDELEWWERKQVREQYTKEQRGQCMWCCSPLSADPPLAIKQMEIDLTLFPESMFKHPVHLQHDHDTGLTEGAVHALCNAVMWQYHGR